MADIRHVVVLMLENRSFDSMLGMFASRSALFNGLRGTESNSFGTSPYRVSNGLPGVAPFTIPSPDPGESYADITEQLYFTANAPKQNPPDMSGFAKNYARQPVSGDFHDPQAVMHYYVESQIPVLHCLAREFGVSDQWFASAPCQTWPNRFFAHTGTCFGIVDNNMFFNAGQEPFHRPSIFRALENAGHGWRVYFHDFPQSILLDDIWGVAAERFRRFSQFLVDADAGALPSYSFIEPNYFTSILSGTPPNDQHPPHDVRYGEKLIADVYNAVRASPCWEHTLLIVTYDEHGGCYDHVSPPKAMPPGDKRMAADGFPFDRFGVRVPAVFVSPWLPPGSLLQPTVDGSTYPFDHTSIIRTVRDAFALPNCLTQRDEVAPSVLPYLTLGRPSNNGPSSLPAVNIQASRSYIKKMGSEPPNEYLKALALAAERLPSGFSTIGREAAELPETIAQLGTRAIAQLEAFLNRL